MDNKTTCPLCSKGITYTGLHKHIFSELHKDAIDILLHKRKASLLTYIGSQDHSSLPFVIPNPKLPTKALKLCFGCNSAYVCKGYTKKHTCSKLKEHLETLTAILAKPIVVQPDVSVIQIDPEEMTKLKKRVNTLETTLKSANKIVDESEDISQAFIELLQWLQENHKDIFIERMVELRLSRLEVFSKMCQELDIEEDEIPPGGGKKLNGTPPLM